MGSVCSLSVEATWFKGVACDHLGLIALVVMVLAAIGLAAFVSYLRTQVKLRKLDAQLRGQIDPTPQHRLPAE